jgi:hypothetical protein
MKRLQVGCRVEAIAFAMKLFWLSYFSKKKIEQNQPFCLIENQSHLILGRSG